MFNRQERGANSPPTTYSLSTPEIHAVTLDHLKDRPQLTFPTDG